MRSIFIALCVWLVIVNANGDQRIISTDANDFAYSGGASRDTHQVISIRSGNPNQITSATSTDTFTTTKLIDNIQFEYRYSCGYSPPSQGATARLILEDTQGNELWTGDINNGATLDDANYWWHKVDPDGSEPNYSEIKTETYDNLQLVTAPQSVRFRIEFTNNGRNVHFLQSDLLIVVTFTENACDVVSSTATETIIPTANIAANQFTYSNGATYDTFANVISMRSGNPNQVSSATPNYCFRNNHDTLINKIVFDYRYSAGYGEHGNAATAKLVLLNGLDNNILWQSEVIGPFNEPRYWWHYSGCNGCESNYSPRIPQEFNDLHLNVKNKNVKLQIVFTNNDRNVHILQKDLAIKIIWEKKLETASMSISNQARDFCLQEYGDWGGTVWASQCNPSLPEQQFEYDPNSKTLTIKSSGKCMDVDSANYNIPNGGRAYDGFSLSGNRDEVGQRMVPKVCDGSSYQKWEFVGPLIKNIETGWCVDIHGYHYDRNYGKARVSGYHCGSRPNQLWNKVSIISISNQVKNYCLTEYGDWGGTMWASPCDPSSTQQQLYYNAGRKTLIVKSSGKCLDVDSANYNIPNGGRAYDGFSLSGNRDEVGQRVVPRDCDGSSYQQWAFDGALIKNIETGWCVDIHGYHYDRNYGKARVSGYHCVSRANQLWNQEIVSGAKSISINWDGFNDVANSIIDDDGKKHLFIYIIVALFLVNIICLSVYCWKLKNNKQTYKMVSVESTDVETDIDY